MRVFSRRPVILGEKTRALSAEGSVLPNLVGRLKRVDPAVMERIEQAGLPDPVREVPERLQKVFERVVAIALLLPFTGESAKQNRRRTIDETALLMHEMCATAEYLRDLLHAALPEPNKKVLNGVKTRLDAEVEMLFRAPINAVKHNHFKLSWLEANPPGGGRSVVKGLVLNGLVGKQTTGPAARRFGEKVYADGYSFPLLLRRAVSSAYAQCDIVDEVLAGALSDGACCNTTAPSAARELVDAADEALLQLSVLPRIGFPGEKKHQMQELVLDRDTVRVVRTFKLARLKPGSRFQFEIAAVRGHAFVLPYWLRED